MKMTCLDICLNKEVREMGFIPTEEIQSLIFELTFKCYSNWDAFAHDELLFFLSCPLHILDKGNFLDFDDFIQSSLWILFMPISLYGKKE